MQPVIVIKGETVVVQVSLGFNISQDTFQSIIRMNSDLTSGIIAHWGISFETDGKDGELLLTLDDSITSGIFQTIGYMNLKRTNPGRQVEIFDVPLEVSFVT